MRLNIVSSGLQSQNVVWSFSTGVRNPLKISDIGFLKTEPNRSQNSKTENLVSAVRFSKN